MNYWYGQIAAFYPLPSSVFKVDRIPTNVQANRCEPPLSKYLIAVAASNGAGTFHLANPELPSPIQHASVYPDVLGRGRVAVRRRFAHLRQPQLQRARLLVSF